MRPPHQDQERQPFHLKCRNYHQVREMKEQRNMLQIEQDEYPESDLTGAEISDLSHRELKLMVLKMLTT